MVSSMRYWAGWVRRCRSGARYLALAFLLVGCAGHAARTEAARSALDVGHPEEALTLYNDALDVDKASELPDDVSGDNTLLLLDRGVILQALKDYKLSSRDLEVADKQVQMLDFSRTAVDDIGKYIFSDDVGPYKAPLYEKLLINTVNMVNYLARRDLGGAKVEARRLAVMQKYIRDNKSSEAALTGPGSYFAGYIFEKAREPDTALRYYDEALQYGNFASLAEPIRRLASRSSYRTPRIQAILDAAPGTAAGTAPAVATPAVATPAVTTPEAPTAPSAAASTEEGADVLVVINYGRVPAKFAKRVPIGLALTLASGWLSPHNVSQANHLAAQGLVTWVNYPELGKASNSTERPGFSLDGKWQTLEGALNVDREARKAWDSMKGAVVAAAVIRCVARVLAGEAVRGGSNDTGMVIASLVTQAVLVAADTPDTRSWATLPAKIALARVRVPPGQHDVLLTAGGRTDKFKINAKPGDWAVVTMTVLR